MKTLYLNIVHAFLKKPFIHTVLRLEGLNREPLLMTTHRLFSLLHVDSTKLVWVF